MKRIYLLLMLILPLSIATAEDTDPAAEDAPEAQQFVTEHSARIGGKSIDYTATAGTMLMKNEDGEPTALMGFTAYVSKGGDQKKRPIMFAYNGGPGSASMWLHMGILGPQRAIAKDAGFSTNGPFERVENEYSILDEADLVMIDPVGTGYAKPVGVGKGEDFWGVDQDIKSVSEFIVQYITENQRWASPKYILGESYGGVRTGGVTYYLLTNHNVALNGIIIVSPFMEMTTGFSGLGIDLPHVLFLPTFAATARYHGALDPSPENLEAFMAEVKDFAYNEYAPALLAGSRLSAERRQQVLAKLEQYTGVSADYWDKANLRINEGRFNQELLRDAGTITGRVDSRFSGHMINKVGENMDYDPFGSAVGPPFLAAFMDYYQGDLNVAMDGNYKVSGGVWGQWDWSHAQPGLGGFKVPFPNTSIDLTFAMKQNPSMRVLMQQGYYDLATPHLATEYYIEHMDLPDDLRDNIELAYYEAGHMMYIHETSMVKFKEDLARFVRDGQ